MLIKIDNYQQNERIVPPVKTGWNRPKYALVKFGAYY
jgi:hypothetical protein